MNAQALFAAFEGIEDQFVMEAAEPEKPRTIPRLLTAVGVTAAALLVAFGVAKWLAPSGTESALQLAPTPTAAVITPSVSEQTAVPVPEGETGSASVYTPETETGVSSESSDALYPPATVGEYVHTEDGDFIILSENPPRYDGPYTRTIDITEKLQNGQYSGITLFAGAPQKIHLQVLGDGSYDLSFEWAPKDWRDLPEWNTETEPYTDQFGDPIQEPEMTEDEARAAFEQAKNQLPADDVSEGIGCEP